MPVIWEADADVWFGSVGAEVGREATTPSRVRIVLTGVLAEGYVLMYLMDSGGSIPAAKQD